MWHFMTIWGALSKLIFNLLDDDGWFEMLVEQYFLHLFFKEKNS